MVRRKKQGRPERRNQERDGNEPSIVRRTNDTDNIDRFRALNGLLSSITGDRASNDDDLDERTFVEDDVFEEEEEKRQKEKKAKEQRHADVNVIEILKRAKPNNKIAIEFNSDLIEELKPKLRPYQRKAVLWMLGRERASDIIQAIDWRRGKEEEEEEEDEELRHTNNKRRRQQQQQRSKVMSNKEEELIMKLPTNWLASAWKTKVERDEQNKAFDKVRGGILAEEMGLGKTVELLCLCLAHKKPKGDFELVCEYSGECKPFVTIKNDDEIKNEEKKNVVIKEDGKEHKEDKEEEEEEEFNVRCVCGDCEDDKDFKGLWVACDSCDNWSHAYCVGVKSDKDEFTCAHCLAEEAGKKIRGVSKTTLIVVPSTILQQWRDEVLTHVKPKDETKNQFEIMIYEGQPQTASMGSKAVGMNEVITAKRLAECDIVITTYDVLRKEIDRDFATNTEVNDGATRARRNNTRRYPMIPPPLTKICWWRVIMDEAQMVGGGMSAPSKMMERIPAVNRWCVTGTPLQGGKKIDDAYGLFKFLRAPPFANDVNDNGFWWPKIISASMKNGNAKLSELVLKESLRNIMWRNEREDVLDELNLPPQNEITTTLHFSPIERHFYQKQHKNCAKEAQNAYERIKSVRTKEEEISRLDISSILHPLLRLRQACDHPQTGGHGIHRWKNAAAAASKEIDPNNIEKDANKDKYKVMSMDEIHDKLVEKARVEAEEAQRLVAFSSNAIAGLRWTKRDYQSVVNSYREVLRLETNAGVSGVRLDSFQLLHALQNLAEVLEIVNKNQQLRSTIPRTLRDSSLIEDANTEKQKYLAQRIGGNLVIAEKDFKKSRMFIDEKLKILGKVNRYWWIQALDDIVDEELKYFSGNEENFKSQFIVKLLEQFDNRWQSSDATWNSRDGLKMCLTRDLNRIFEYRDLVIADAERVTKISEDANRQDVINFASCSMCRKGSEFAVLGVKCAVCACEINFDQLQNVLFGVGRDERRNPNAKVKSSTRNKTNEELRKSAHRDVNAPSCAEQTLKALMKKCGRDIRVFAQAQTQALEEIRKEFTKIRQLMSHQREKMYALDELNMSTTRIRLRTENEMVRIDGQDQLPEYLRASILYPAEVDGLLNQHTQEKTLHENELKQAFGQLRFLHSLKQRNEKRKTFNCPLCLETFDETQSHEVNKIPRNAIKLLNKNKTKKNNFGGEIIDSDDDDDDDDDDDVDLKSADMAILPCGHELCVTCSFAMYGKPQRDQKKLLNLSPLPINNNERQQRQLEKIKNENKRGKCPTCRQECAMKEISYVTWKEQDQDVRDNIEQAKLRKEELRIKLAMDNLQISRTVDDPRMLEMLGPASEHARVESQIEIVGAWGTKIDAVVRRVKFLSTFNKHLKILIFSEWDEALMIVDAALKSNDIRSIVPTTDNVKDLKGNQSQKFSKNVKMFVDDISNPINCLLLPLKRAGAGLNLTCANHVIMLEPTLENSQALQAIKRVDRIGQTKNTLVHRFLLEDTIEMNVSRVQENRRKNKEKATLTTALMTNGSEEEEDNDDGTGGSLTTTDIEELLREKTLTTLRTKTTTLPLPQK